MSLPSKWFSVLRVGGNYNTMHLFAGTGGDTFDINFAGGYIDKGHVKALVSNGDVITLQFISVSRVRTSRPISVGESVLIYRDTPKVVPLAQFSDGALLTGSNLDRNAKQAVFVAAEVLDRFDTFGSSLETSVSQVSEALTVANMALAVSNSIDGKATDALSMSQEAKEAAEHANTVAAGADSKADAAASSLIELARRSYAEAGYNLVSGSFEDGGKLTSVRDVLIKKETFEAFSFEGVYPTGGYTVEPGTVPTVVNGFISRKDALLRNPNKLYVDFFKYSADYDYTEAIKRGIKYCTDNGIRDLHFRSAVYQVSDTLGSCSVNFISDNRTTIRNTNTNTLGSSNGKPIINFINGFTTIKGVVFDGGVSSSVGTVNIDPSSWSSANYETWYGFQGPIVTASNGFSIIDCESVNFYRAGMYISGCSDFMLVRSKTRRTRGSFGDGVFIGNGCHNFTVIGPSASDFTRGGLVCDMGCYDFTIMGASSTYGHDWSAMYGGTEYSAGLWVEKSTRASIFGGRMSDTGYFGVILSLEVDGFIPTPYREYMTLGISGAHIDGALVGINCRNAPGATGKISVSNVDSLAGAGGVAMLLRGFPGITVDVIGGSATVKGAVAGACIAVGSLGQSGVLPVYNLRGVGLGHTNPAGAANAKSRLNSADVGDICLYTPAEYAFQLSVDDCYSLADPAEILIGIRTARITPSWQNPSISINTPKHKVVYVDSSQDTRTQFKSIGTVFSKLKVYCKGYMLDNCEFESSAEMYFNSLWKFNNNIIRDTAFKYGGNNIHYVGAAPVNTLAPAFMLDSCRFSGDLTEQGSYLVDVRRVDAGGARIGWIHRDVIYTNLGANGVNSSAVSCLLGDYNLPAYKYSNVFDVGVTNAMRTSSGVITDPAAANLGVVENLVISE